jgi:hypothetical protein
LLQLIREKSSSLRFNTIAGRYRRSQSSFASRDCQIRTTSRLANDDSRVVEAISCYRGPCHHIREFTLGNEKVFARVTISRRKISCEPKFSHESPPRKMSDKTEQTLKMFAEFLIKPFHSNSLKNDPPTVITRKHSREFRDDT